MKRKKKRKKEISNLGRSPPSPAAAPFMGSVMKNPKKNEEEERKNELNGMQRRPKKKENVCGEESS